MCTAANYKTKNHYFGRNLDLEFSYNEAVTITPRNYPFHFRKVKDLKYHYAMIGMAIVVDDYPLYYDATNEKGLSMAGLNFPNNAEYKLETDGGDNVAPFEFIPWILGQCANVSEARGLLQRLNLVEINFSEQFPLSPLHWLISDRDESLTVESTKEGLKVYDNPVGVLTNNPPFDMQMFQLNNYMRLSKEDPKNSFAKDIPLKLYSRGMGALGLPGDLSSASRFVKAVFTKMNSVSGDSELESISQMFHILGSVEQQRGCVLVKEPTIEKRDVKLKSEEESKLSGHDEMIEGNYEITIYTSCCNTDKGIYYYTTYENRQITAVDMYKENIEGSKPVQYPLITGQQICMQN